MNLLAYMSDDLDFLAYIRQEVPQGARTIDQFMQTPTCTTCQDGLKKLAESLEGQAEELLAGFEARYRRKPRTRFAPAAKSRLLGDFFVKPEEYRDFIRTKAANHVWTTMQTMPQKDGTWRLTFG